MSVALAPPLPPAASAPSAPEDRGGKEVQNPSNDFLGLLLGQMARNGELPSIDPLLEDEPLPHAEALTEQLAVMDPALLLSTLALTPVTPQKTLSESISGHLPASEEESLSSAGDADIALTLTGLPPPIPHSGTQQGPATDTSAKLLGQAGDGLSAKVAASEGGSALSAQGNAPPAAITQSDTQPAASFAETLRAFSGAEGNSPSVALENAPLAGIAAPHQNSGTAAQSGTTALNVATPVRDPSWSNDVGQKIVWMASNEKQSAQLTLNPPQMGPIEISLNLTKDSASAYFVSANAEVRQALEAALPKLREMLASVGVELGQANVGAESFQQRPGSDAPPREQSRWRSDNAILGALPRGPSETSGVTTLGGMSRVDIFA